MAECTYVEISLETVDFHQIFLDKSLLSHLLVDLRRVLDVLGSVGIVECAEGLLQARPSW